MLTPVPIRQELDALQPESEPSPPLRAVRFFPARQEAAQGRVLLGDGKLAPLLEAIVDGIHAGVDPRPVDTLCTGGAYYLRDRCVHAENGRPPSHRTALAPRWVKGKRDPRERRRGGKRTHRQRQEG